MKLLDSDRSNLEKAALMLHFYDIPENKLVFVQCNSISVFKYKLHVYFSCFDMKLNNRICFQRLNVDLYHHRPYNYNKSPTIYLFDSVLKHTFFQSVFRICFVPDASSV